MKRDEIRISDTSLLYGYELQCAKMERLLREGYEVQRDQKTLEWVFRKYI
jgi:hypothetical protein